MNKRIKLVCIIIALALLIGILNVNIKNVILQKIYPITYSEYVYKYSEQNNVDPLLIFSIIKAESNFNEKSVSASNAKGLMQLMTSTADELADKLEMENYDIFDAQTNIALGTKYISILLEYYEENLYLALAAYNAGIGNVNKWIDTGIIKNDGSNIENIPYKETSNYVRKVVRDYRIYKELY